MLKLYKYLDDKFSIVTGLLAGIIFIFCSVPTLAAITRGYGTDDTRLKPGMVVALSQSSTPEDPKVEAASVDQIERVIGVATTIDESLVTISSGEQASYVESDGEVGAFVVNLNGEIRYGDLLTLSPIKGILAKASSSQPIVAIALEDFASDKSETYIIQDGAGTKNVLIQRLRVNLDRKAYANLDSLKEKSMLTDIGRALIGKDVGEIQMIIALIIFFIVLVAEGTILYGAISSAISSLGRNPLAKNIIRRELIRVLFIAMAVLALGVAAIYAVLWV